VKLFRYNRIRRPIRLGYSVYQDPYLESQREAALIRRIDNNFPRYLSQSKEIIRNSRLEITRPGISFTYSLSRRELHLQHAIQGDGSESFESGVVLPLLPWKRASAIIRFMAEVELETWPSV
jgi:hypothetical protein